MTESSTARTVLLTPTPDRVRPDGASRLLVLTPNRRAAAARGVAPVSLEQAARARLRAHGLQDAGLLAQHRALRRAVEDALAPADLEGALRAVAPAVRDLLRAGLDGDVREVGLSGRARQALALARRYRDLLRDRRQVDPAEVLWVAASLAGGRERVLVVGYPQLGPGEYAFLDALAAPGSLLALPASDDDAARALGPRGWAVERPRESARSLGERLADRFHGGDAPIPEARAYRFVSQEDEVRFVLGNVKAMLHDGVPADAIVVAARDDAAYGPLLAAVAWEYEVPLHASYGVSLSHTRVGAWLACLAEVVREGAPFEPTARLLAHPLCDGLGPDLWAAARREHPHGPASWSDLDARLASLAWPARASRADFSARLDAAPDAFGVIERAHRPGDRVALGRFRAAASGLGDPAAQTLSRDAFLAEVLELLNLLTTPVDPGGRGVALHTPLAVYGARYRHVFVLGAAEGVLPAPVEDDPFLDFFERRDLAAAGLPLPSAVEAARREKRSFEALLRTATASLVLCYPEVMLGRARIASPYFAALGLAPAAPPKRPPASVEEARRTQLQRDPDEADPTGADPVGADPVLNAARHAWRVERRRESEAPCDLYDGVIGEGVDPASWTFSASQLVRLGQCPFKWFAGELLGLRELEEADEDISPRLKGRIWHGALERALTDAVGEPDPRARALDALEAAFAEAEVEEGAPTVPSWPLLRRDHLSRLRQAIEAPDFLPDGCDVVAVESRFRGEWRGLCVVGVVDRVDRTPDGLRLVDYKTRASKPDGAQDAARRARLDVQLPLYLETAAPALFPDDAVLEARYYSLTKAEALPPVRSDGAALDALAERVKRHLREGAYPVAPDVDGKACAFCTYDALCRRGPRLERKATAGAA